MITQKPCTVCGAVKALEDFNKEKRNKTHGRRPECRACQSIAKKTYESSRPGVKRWKKIERSYSLTQLEWETIFEKQDRKCAICKTTVPGGNGWHTDHNHETNKVRGILCGNCNRGLGRFKDQVSLLWRAFVYLLKQ